MLFSSETAHAQSSTEVTDPPQLLPSRATPATEMAATRRSAPGEQVLDLNIEYVDGAIFNPSNGRDDKVRLRSYTQPGAAPPKRYISPAIHSRPGETLRVKLHNKLPPDASCAGDHGNINHPHCFNGTNLHTHGLWVNPAGNGDNVLLSIDPGASFEYEYAIPPQHPAGTFWYHTHRHGSTALQVSSGMAGALIIHGNRQPTPTEQGDLDTLLAGAKERIIVLQQIQYGCLNAQGVIKVREAVPPGQTDEKVVAWICDRNDVGGVETYKDSNGNGFGPGSWGGSARYTSLNGLILPYFKATQGGVERWRVIHGGVRDTVGLQFRKAKPGARLDPGPKLAAPQMEAFIEAACETETLPFHLVAADGLTMAAAQRTTIATFQPGYRFDALVVFPEAANYCVVDADTQAASVGGVPVGSRLLGMVRVEPGIPVGDVSQYLTTQLVAAAQEKVRDEAVRQEVVDQLKDGLKLTHFTPHPDVTDTEVTGTQELTFLINVKANPIRFEVGSQDYEPRPYDPGRVDRQLTLHGVDEWTLRSGFVSHPFHIHVNPFQIVGIWDPNGKEVSGLDTVDDYALQAGPPGQIDPQYRGLKNVWKDTLWIKSLIGEVDRLPVVPGSNPPVTSSGIYTIKVRTRYQRYIGEFVLHCHILDHEDQGMMQNVAIVLPGGTPASVNAAEGGHSGH